jgi:hypothetical protein
VTLETIRNRARRLCCEDEHHHVIASRGVAAISTSGLPRAFAAGGNVETGNETALKCAVLQVVPRPGRDAFTAVDFTEIAMFAGLLDEIDSKP